MPISLRHILPILGLTALGFAARPAHAQFFNNSTGFASPTNTVTFSEVSIPDTQQLTTQLSAQGVTFTGPLFIDTTNFTGASAATGFSGAYAETFNRNTGSFTTGPYDIIFNGPVSAAAFAAVDQIGVYTFTALLGATVVDSATLTIPFIPGAGFIGFQNRTFDRIRITTASTSNFAVDTIQFNSGTLAAVPEPSEWLAMGMAGTSVMGLMVRARRRKAVKSAA